MKSNEALNKIEKTLRILLILFLVTTVLTNGKKMYDSNQNPVYRSGTEETQLLSAPFGSLKLEIEGSNYYPLLEVMVNGEYIKSFENNKQLEIQVKDRDVIQLKGTMYDNEIRIKIVDITSIKSDNLKKQVSINGNIVSLGIARL